MPLADLLQWADSTRGCGVLEIDRPFGRTWMMLRDRSIVACSVPDIRSVSLDKLVPELRVLQAPSLPEDVHAVEQLYDHFLDEGDSFRFRPNGGPEGEAIELDVSIQEVVMEGMRFLDEWSEVAELYPNDLARFHRVPGPLLPAFSPMHQALLELAERDISLQQARLCLGVSQPALLRNIETLRRLGHVVVEGAPQGSDMVEQMLRKASVLLRERQFEEAAYVFSTLLATRPGSRHIRQLLRNAERDHVEELYRQVPGNASVVRTPRMDQIGSHLTRADREVTERINDRWDVSTLVLASPLREVETLRTVRKLHRMEAVSLVLPQTRRAGQG